MSGARSFGWTVALLGFTGLSGIGVLIWGQTRQVYRVPFEVASDAYLKWCTDEPRVDPLAGDRYLAMFGDRYGWLDLGLGLVTTAVAGVLLAAALYISRPDASWLRTPSRRGHFLLAGWGVIGWAYFGVIHSLEKDLDRQLFSSCADSIGIPIYGAYFFTITLLIVCSIVGFMLMHGFGALPIPLYQWDRARPRYSWTVTIFFGAIIAVVAALMVERQACPCRLLIPHS